MNSATGGFDSHALPPLAPTAPAVTDSASTAAAQPAYELRAYAPGDEHAILATFNRVFARVDPNFVPRTLEEWRWRYEQNPAGRRLWIAVAPDGRVAAQYAGLPQRVRLEGAPATFTQSVDSMLDPECRRGLGKQPLFVQLTWAWTDAYWGAPPERDPLMWGLPVPAAWRIGQKQLRYEFLRTQAKLCARLDGLERPAAPGVEVESAPGIPPEIGELFERCAGEHAAIAVRDQRYLAWRFERNPSQRYEYGLARRAGRIEGIAIFRAGEFDGVRDGLVCDWLAPRGDEAVGNALREWLAARARAAGCERLCAVFPDTSPEWLVFQRAGWRVRPTRYFAVGGAFLKKIDLRWLYKNWYYTLGDTDLC